MSSVPCHLAPELLNCWHNCDRQRAVQLLLSGERRPGTYLLRPCHSRVEKYAISVLQESRKRGLRGLFQLGRGRRQPVVRNYLIKERNGGYYIYMDQCFSEVHYLIAYYAKPRRKMHTALQFPLLRSERPATPAAGAKQLQVDKDKQLRLKQKIGEGSYEMYSAEINGRHVVSLVLDGGREIPDFKRSSAAPRETRTIQDALDEEEEATWPPLLPPRPAPMSPDSRKQTPTDGGQKLRICTQKAALQTEDWLPGADGGALSTLMARVRLGRCRRIAERMLQALLK